MTLCRGISLTSPQSAARCRFQEAKKPRKCRLFEHSQGSARHCLLSVALEQQKLWHGGVWIPSRQSRLCPQRPTTPGAPLRIIEVVQGSVIHDPACPDAVQRESRLRPEVMRCRAGAVSGTAFDTAPIVRSRIGGDATASPDAASRPGQEGNAVQFNLIRAQAPKRAAASPLRPF